MNVSVNFNFDVQADVVESLGTNPVLSIGSAPNVAGIPVPQIGDLVNVTVNGELRPLLVVGREFTFHSAQKMDIRVRLGLPK